MTVLPTTLHAAAIWVLLVASGASQAALGQTVLGGQVREEATGAPLPGVLVSMLGAGGERLAAVLTDSDGRFAIRVPSMGRVRLLAERIGLQSVETQWLEIGAEGTPSRELLMRPSAVEVEGLVVAAPIQDCRPDPTVAPTIQRWWDEARKALDVTAVVQSRQLVRFRIYRFEREWTSDLRSILREDGRRDLVFSSQPFSSTDPNVLEEEGYVRGAPGRRVFHAPDAEVLLSPGFLATHCFRVESDDERPHWIGLKFEPTRSRKVPDIIGTFWVDTTTSELKALEYRYANLPADIPGERAGGRVDFQYLPSGAWVIPRWWVRTPRVGLRTSRIQGRSNQVAEVVGYVDTGGRAEAFGANNGQMDTATEWGQIEGFVFDSLAGGPLAGARVQVSGTRLSALSNLDGAFVIDSVPAGTHVLTFFHPAFAAVRWPFSAVDVTVAPDAPINVGLAVPSFFSVAATLCAGSDQVEAILVLRLLDPSGQPHAAVPVQARWQVGDPYAALAREARSEMYTGSDGVTTFCTVPADTDLQIRVRLEERWHDLLDVALRGRQVLVREINVGAPQR